MSQKVSALPSEIGRFRIDSLLGIGGMGAVYKAFDPKLRRDVAVKTIRPEVERPESIQRFYREAQALARLSHKNIIVVHDVGEYDGGVYIAMEYLKGQNLTAAIEQGTLRLRSKLEVMIAVLDALQHAHDEGVIHRDIKPSNVHLLPDGSVKLLDFGLARIEEADAVLTMTGDVLCTPHYASPEQLRAERVDARSDLFSAGAMAYQLLVGRLPFDAPSVASVLAKVLSEEPPPMDAVWMGDVPALDGIVRRAMAKDPNARYQSAAAMRSALQQTMTTYAAAIEAFDAANGLEDLPTIVLSRSADTADPTLVRTPRELSSVPSSGAVPMTPAPRHASANTTLPPLPARVAAGGLPAGEAMAEPSRRAGLWAAAAAAVVALAVGGFWYSERPGTPAASGSGAENGPGVAPGLVESGEVKTVAAETPSPAGALSESPGAGKTASGVPGGASASSPSGGTSAAVGANGAPRAETAGASSGAAMGVMAPARQLFNAATGAAAKNAGLKYRVVQRLPSGEEVDVDPTQSFRSGDRVKFVFESNIDGYLYVAQKGSSGLWAVLFPGPVINGGVNSIRRGSQYQIPDNGWFRLDATPGTEQVFVVLSREPLNQMPGFRERVVKTETLSASVVDEVRNGIRSRDLIFEKDPAPKGDKAPQATYVVNRDELGTAVAATISLAHGQ